MADLGMKAHVIIIGEPFIIIRLIEVEKGRSNEKIGLF